MAKPSGQRFAFTPKRLMDEWYWRELTVYERGVLLHMYATTHPWGVFALTEEGIRKHAGEWSDECRQAVDKLSTLRLLEVAMSDLGVRFARIRGYDDDAPKLLRDRRGEWPYPFRRKDFRTVSSVDISSTAGRQPVDYPSPLTRPEDPSLRKDLSARETEPANGEDGKPWTPDDALGAFTQEAQLAARRYAEHVASRSGGLDHPDAVLYRDASAIATLIDAVGEPRFRATVARFVTTTERYDNPIAWLRKVAKKMTAADADKSLRRSGGGGVRQCGPPPKKQKVIVLPKTPEQEAEDAELAAAFADIPVRDRRL
jgi:hypothetical protein